MDVAGHRAFGPVNVSRSDGVDQLTVVARATPGLLQGVTLKRVLDDGNFDRVGQRVYEALVLAGWSDDPVALTFQRPDSSGLLRAGVVPLEFNLIVKLNQLVNVLTGNPADCHAGDFTFNQHAQIKSFSQQALQTGVLDCAITGTLGVYKAKWDDGANFLYAMPINWGASLTAMNLNTWAKLDAVTQKTVLQEFGKLEKAN